MGNEDLLNALQAENRRLRELLIRHGISLESVATPAKIFTEEEKIRIFRSLFRGREDVYPIRWERADGRKGYSPRGERDWLAYNAARPEDRERIDRETKTYLPLTDQVARAHLKGEITIGVYPLLQDESCWFLAADFDKSSWQEDTIAFLRTCTNGSNSAGSR